MSMLIFYFSFLYSFKKSDSYRIKLSGSDELYLAVVGKKVRMIEGNRINEADTKTEVAVTGDHWRKDFQFCDLHLSAKSTDPGVIPTDFVDYLTQWTVISSGNGYKLKNGNGKCLTMLDDTDKETGGYYLNTRDCNEDKKNIFVFLNAGFSINFCKKNAKLLCKDMGYTEKKRKHKKKKNYPEEISDQHARRKDSRRPQKTGDVDSGFEDYSDDFSVLDDRSRRPKRYNRVNNSPRYPPDIDDDSEMLDQESSIAKTHHHPYTEHAFHHHKNNGLRR